MWSQRLSCAIWPYLKFLGFRVRLQSSACQSIGQELVLNVLTTKENSNMFTREHSKLHSITNSYPEVFFPFITPVSNNVLSFYPPGRKATGNQIFTQATFLKNQENTNSSTLCFSPLPFSNLVITSSWNMLL